MNENIKHTLASHQISVLSVAFIVMSNDAFFLFARKLVMNLKRRRIHLKSLLFSNNVYIDRFAKSNAYFIISSNKKSTKFTLSENFIDHDGAKILEEIDQYPIIFTRKVAKAQPGKCIISILYPIYYH